MQSSNPVFRKAEGFNGKSQTYPASGMSYPAYGGQSAGRPRGTQTYDPYSSGADRRPADADLDRPDDASTRSSRRPPSRSA